MSVEEKLEEIKKEYDEKLAGSKLNYDKKLEKLEKQHEKEQREMTKWYGQQIIKFSKSPDLIEDEEESITSSQESSNEEPGRLPGKFFKGSPKKVAKNLVGKILRTEYYKHTKEGVITEVALLSGNRSDKGLRYGPGRIHLYDLGDRKALVISAYRGNTASGVMITKVKDKSNGSNIPLEKICDVFKVDKVLEKKPISTNKRLWIYNDNSPGKSKPSKEMGKEIPKCVGYYKLSK